MENAEKVRAWVEANSTRPVKKFRPTAVRKATGVPLEEVGRALFDMVEEGSLGVEWELTCPECFRTVKVFYQDPRSNLPDTAECTVCGIEFEPAPDLVFPLFAFNKY
ncbi:MAG: hypothetical protein K6T65_05480 [Peptococcaceae bacterium]|nr:hypothetical protein [Peptococcaceae bacterium]